MLKYRRPERRRARLGGAAYFTFANARDRSIKACARPRASIGSPQRVSETRPPLAKRIAAPRLIWTFISRKKKPSQADSIFRHENPLFSPAPPKHRQERRASSLIIAAFPSRNRHRQKFKP
jgi:hypothetical protein